MSKPAALWRTRRNQRIPGIGDVLEQVSAAGARRYALRTIDQRDQEVGVVMRSVITLVSAATRSPAVTNILDEFRRWAEERGVAITPEDLQAFERQKEKRISASKRHGMDAHELIEDWANGALERASVPVAGRSIVSALDDWADSYGATPVAGSAERLTCHPELRYAGRIDCHVLDARGAEWLVDFKTTTAPELVRDRPELRMSDHLQVAMLLLAQERCGRRCEGGLIVYLGEDGAHSWIETLADPEAARAAAEWGRARDRLRDQLRSPRRAEQLSVSPASGDWIPWDPDEVAESAADRRGDDLPSQRFRDGDPEWNDRAPDWPDWNLEDA